MLRQSRQRLITAHERVRRDIAGQLQGGVEEGLIALRGRLREFLCGFDTASEPARHLGGVIERLSESITKQVAVLGRQLYPSSLNEGIVAAFQCFRDQFGASLDIEIEPDEQLVKNERADGDYLPEQVRLAAYRIAEEALTNAVKRANASMVTVRLDSSREGWLCMTVRDGGHNLDAAATSIEPEMGTMQDYAEAVDGQSSVRSESGVGTEVTAVLPLSRPETEHPLSSEKGGK
jgi:signal transduction histidine kinase